MYLNRHKFSPIIETLIVSMGFLFPAASATAFAIPSYVESNYTLPNPMMRICNLVGGFSIVINVNENQILLCQIGSSYLGSLELFLFKTEHKSAESIQSFLAGITDSKKCTSVELVSDLDGRSYEICFFSDGSMMDTSTIKKGIEHSDNRALREVLLEAYFLNTSSKPFLKLQLKSEVRF